MGLVQQLFKNCRLFLRPILWLTVVPLISSCNKVGVSATQGSPQQLANMCGLDEQTSPTGPKITAPPAQSQTQANITLEGTCDGTADVKISGSGIAAAVTTACVGGKFQQPLTLVSGDGIKDLLVTQDGIAGEGKRCMLLDTTPPIVNITPPINTYIPSSTLSVIGTCETGIAVDVTQGTGSLMTVNCENGRFTAHFPSVGGDGAKNIVASQRDLAGNTGNDNQQYIVDTLAPIVKILTPAANTTVKNSIPVTGTCEAGLPVTVGGTAAVAPVSTACVSGQFSATIQIQNRDATFFILAEQTDLAGNRGWDQRNVIRDTTAPIITINSPSSGTIALSGVTVSGTCTMGLSVVISGAGVSAPQTVQCVNNAYTAAVIFSAGDGSKNVIATQTDLAGNIGSDNRSFLRDATPPAVKITAPDAGSATKSTIALFGTCETGLTVSLSGAITPMNIACNGGQFSAVVTLTAPDGNKNVVASQTDSVGNIGTDNRNFVLQTVLPTITINTPVANTITKSSLTIGGNCVTGIVVNLNGAIAAPVNVNCTAGVYSANVVLAGSDGIKNIVAAQTDSVGNTGTANRNFILDATAPIVKITAPAAGTVAKNEITLTGTCEAGLQVQLSGAGLSAPGPVTCPSGTFSANVTFSNGDGIKNVIASQTDAAGNVGSDNRDFERDTTPPAITITGPIAGTATRSDITLVGTCSNGLPINLSGAIAPSLAVCTGGAWTAVVTLLPPEGVKNVIASQTDAAGNAGSDNRSFELKTTAPAIKITGPAVNFVTKGGLTLTGTCTTGLPINIGGAVTGSAVCTSGIFSTNLTLTGADGSKNISVTQTDAANNSGSDNRDFVLDTTAPIVRFTAPAAATVAQTGVTVTGTCEAGLQVQLTGTGLSAPATLSCTNGAFSANVAFSAGDGGKNIIATQTDSVGNVGSDSRDFTRDTAAPVIKISTPLAGAVTQGDLTLTGTCESGLTVTVGGTGLGTPKTATCTAGLFSSAITLSSPDGSKNVSVSQTDLAGNVGSDNRSFVRDTTAPNVTITSPANGTKISDTFVLTGACEAGLALNITGDISAVAASTCPTGGTYRVSLTITAGNGAKKVAVSQTDLAGNTGRDQGNFVKEAKPSATEVFIADPDEGKVDILFVDDNSASMDPEQAALGQKFPSFVQELQGLDWQAGITTTDCSTGAWGICGSLLNMSGTTSKILTANVAAYDQVFKNTIQRPETLNCAAMGNCPSGREEGLKAAASAIDKRATDNSGFFRDNAALAVVILSDEDEQSNGPITATKPQAVIDKVTAAFGAAKKFKGYAITVLTGDAACLKTQQDQQGGIGAPGTFFMELARLTGGQSVSICAPDYSVTLKQIGQDLRKLTNAVKLSRTPIASSVQVTFTPAQSITWTVSGDSVLFNTPVPVGTKIEVFYEY